MKVKFLITSLFLSSILFGQNTIDTLYNPESGAQYFFHIINDSVSNRTIILCASENNFATDSTFYQHIIIYERQPDGSIKEINRIAENYWRLYSQTPIPPEFNQLVYPKEDTAVSDNTKNKKVKYVILQTSDSFKTYSQADLPVPFRRYLLHGCLKTKTGYVISGDTDIYVTSSSFIAGYDLAFNLKWLKVFNFQSRIASILPAQNGYILTGTKGFVYNGFIWQAKVDTVGTIIWQKDYHDSLKYYGSSVITQGVKTGNLYYNVGFTALNYNNYPNYLGYLNGVNENGDLIIEKFYNQHSNFTFTKLIEKNNVLYAVANIDSTIIKDSVYGNLIHFSKISSDGKIQWYQIYSHLPAYNQIGNIYKTNNGFMMCGSSFNQNRKKEFDSTGHWDADGWLLKVDTNGCIVPGCKPNVYLYGGVQHILFDNSLIEVYPNPAIKEFTVNLKGNNFTESINDVTLYDVTGKELFHQTLKSHQLSIIIQRSFNYTGLAFVVVQNKNGTFYKKIILQ